MIFPFAEPQTFEILALAAVVVITALALMFHAHTKR